MRRRLGVANHLTRPIAYPHHFIEQRPLGADVDVAIDLSRLAIIKLGAFLEWHVARQPPWTKFESAQIRFARPIANAHVGIEDEARTALGDRTGHAAVGAKDESSAVSGGHEAAFTSAEGIVQGDAGSGVGIGIGGGWWIVGGSGLLRLWLSCGLVAAKGKFFDHVDGPPHLAKETPDDELRTGTKQQKTKR